MTPKAPHTRSTNDGKSVYVRKYLATLKAVVEAMVPGALATIPPTLNCLEVAWRLTMVVVGEAAVDT